MKIAPNSLGFAVEWTDEPLEDKTVKKFQKDNSVGYGSGGPGGKSNGLGPDDLQAVVI